MANAVSLDPARRFRGPSADVRELTRKLELIETRPDAVLTWADVADQTRALWRRLRPASR